MHRLREYERTKPWFDGIGNNKIHAAAKKLLEKLFEVHIGIERFLLKIDYKIKIAGRPRFPSDSGPKKSEAANTKSTDDISV
jgi:hypothetical protein